MPLDKQRLEKLKQLIEITNDGLTREEFLESFNKILLHFQKMEIALKEKIVNKLRQEKENLDKLKQEFSQVIADARNESDTTLGGFKRKTLEAINKLFTRNEVNKKLKEQVRISDLKIIELNNLITEVINKVASVKDGDKGEDADEESIIKEVLKKIKVPEIDRTELEELKKELDDIRRIRRRGGGTSAIGIANAMKWILHTEVPSGLINGSNKVYTVENTLFAVFAFSLNGEVITQLPNYTIAGKTITFSTALPAAFSGKDFEIKYIG